MRGMSEEWVGHTWALSIEYFFQFVVRNSALDYCFNFKSLWFGSPI
jgi:hypothetical protein